MSTTPANTNRGILSGIGRTFSHFTALLAVAGVGWAACETSHWIRGTVRNFAAIQQVSALQKDIDDRRKVCEEKQAEIDLLKAERATDKSALARVPTSTEWDRINHRFLVMYGFLVETANALDKLPTWQCGPESAGKFVETSRVQSIAANIFKHRETTFDFMNSSLLMVYGEPNNSTVVMTKYGDLKMDYRTGVITRNDTQTVKR